MKTNNPYGKPYYFLVGCATLIIIAIILSKGGGPQGSYTAPPPKYVITPLTGFTPPPAPKFIPITPSKVLLGTGEVKVPLPSECSKSSERSVTCGPALTIYHAGEKKDISICDKMGTEADVIFCKNEVLNIFAINENNPNKCSLVSETTKGNISFPRSKEESQSRCILGYINARYYESTVNNSNMSPKKFCERISDTNLKNRCEELFIVR